MWRNQILQYVRILKLLQREASLISYMLIALPPANGKSLITSATKVMFSLLVVSLIVSRIVEKLLA